MSKKKRGHPEKVLTEEQKKQIPVLASVLTVEQIADFFNICRTTFFKMKGNDKEIDELYKKGRAKAIASIGGNLVQRAKTDNVAAIFYLKTQGGWREQKEDQPIDLKPEINITVVTKENENK